MLARVMRSIVDFALPPRCPGCQEPVAEPATYCQSCWSSFDFLVAACARCARPIDEFGESECAPCRAVPGPIDQVIAAVRYNDAAARTVIAMKHGRRPGLAVGAARLLAGRMPSAPVVMVPVPLHRRRLRTRGFNQALTLSRALARPGDTVLPDRLRRVRDTMLTRGQGRAARVHAMRDSFAVKGKLGHPEVWLVDDVMTTGATARACARALKEAGATHVGLICFARVVSED